MVPLYYNGTSCISGTAYVPNLAVRLRNDGYGTTEVIIFSTASTGTLTITNSNLGETYYCPAPKKVEKGAKPKPYYDRFNKSKRGSRW